ncbi:MAG: Lacal_2735 family protein [Salinivirgaceae bacterium]|jgi:hypothetical protein|nr:Lacal_2735 family protein [Salinivirgaceae bacterium]
MFGLFRKKSEIDKLEDVYKKMLKEAYSLSTINRKLSDSKTKEANEILKKIELLENQN